MNCKNCGTSISPNHKFCLNCGTPVNNVESPVVSTTPVNPEIPATVTTPEVPVQPVVTQAPVQQPTPVVQTPVAPATPVVPQVSAQQMMPTGPVPGTPTPVMPGAAVPQKNDNKLIFAIIGIIAVTAIIIVVMYFVLGGKDEEESSSGTSKDNNIVENNKEEDNDEEVVTTPTTGTTLELGNFTYTIPTDYTAEAKDDYVALSNYTYYVELMSVEGISFAILSDEDTKSAIEEMGATVISSQTKTFDGKNYAVVRAVYSGVDCVFLYSKSTPNYGVVGFGYRLDYTYSEDLEKEVASLVNAVVYNSTANVETDVEVDLSKLGQE